MSLPTDRGGSIVDVAQLAAATARLMQEDDGDDYGEEEDDYYDAGRPYRPPGNSQDGERSSFAANIPRNFIVPERLRDKPYELIEAANDWHYAMMNDHPRNVFYRDALSRVITPESVVLEIGAGSGLLSIIAASLGAKTVIAIEANRHLAAVAREIIKRNGYESRIHIINKMSTEVAPEEIAHYGTPTVLLSEILGTLLLGESAMHYVMDARQRLFGSLPAVVPRRGSQFACLIESHDIASITSVKGWEGIDLATFNALQDTTSMVFTKQYGFRFSSCKYRELARRVPVLDIDFAHDVVGVWKNERRQRIQALASGTVHAVMASWEVYEGEGAAAGGGGDAGGAAGASAPLVMSTHPDQTLDNFPRDMQWGQGLQLIEDMSKATDGGPPTPFEVTEGEWLILVTRFSPDGVTINFGLERDDGSGGCQPCMPPQGGGEARVTVD